MTRLSPSETFFRTAELDRAAADGDKRTVELSFSSELPVQRGSFYEILSHADGHCDLSRLNSGHPLLLNHDTEQLIGVVESARVDADKKGRATVRFSKSQKADEIWRDVQDGIRRLVSVGYRRTEELGAEVKDGRELVRFAWQPYEISLVSVPADATVGVGREQTLESQQPEPEKPKTPEPEKEQRIMSDKIESVVEQKPDTRAKEILAMAKRMSDKVAGVREMADKAIESDLSVESFRQQILDNLPKAEAVAPKIEKFTARDISGYSITRAINGIMNGRLDGLERELSDEIALRSGKAATGFWLPNEVLGQRNAVAGTGTLGGMVVATQNLGSEFVELLRSQAVVGQLGARMLQLSSNVTIPRQNGAGTVNWAATETSASTLSGVNFTQLTLSPKCATSEMQYSKQLLATSNPSIDAIIRDDAIKSIALAIDLAAFHGAGTSGEPTGIVNTTGIATVALGTNGSALTTANAYASFVSLETEIATDNADVGSLAYVINAATRGKLKSITKTGLDSTFVWEPGNTVNGYRTAISNQLKTNLTKGTATTICTAAFFGNFNDLLIAEFGTGTDVVVDPYTLASNRVVRILTNKWVDIGVRRPQSFSAILDIIN